ncbi:MAG: hypothetical protein OXT09_27890 [Myxococcales bacterium]|nr:hypothetical protein [Myxococcales bacterium]
MRPIRAALALAAALLLWPATLAAQEAPEPKAEPVDVTRLDVERLPPEAIELSRDMFALGPMVLAHIGGRGYAGGVGRLVEPGVLATVGLGYGLASWFSLAAMFEASVHRTDAPAPPSPGTFEVLDAVLEARLTLPVSARAGLWLAGQGGLGFATSDLLQLYGVQDAGELGPLYGGSLGFDWHMLSRHHSLGVLAGARLQPNLDAIDEQTLAIHAAAYLQYSF